MASNQSAYGGSVGSGFRLVLESHEVSVDTANNRSLIEVTLYMTNVANEGYVYNSTPNPWSLSGSVSASGNITYSFNPNNTIYMLNNNQYWVGHNTDGTGSVSLSCSHDAQNSPYLTTAGTSVSYALTTINRYADITSFQSSSVTDSSFTLSATTDNSASVINFSIDGGSTYTGSGSGTSASQTFSNVASGQTFNCYAHAVSAASGLQTYSGLVQVNTAIQNKFFDMAGL